MIGDYQVIVESRSEEDARAQLLAWFEQNKTVHQTSIARIGRHSSEDLISDVIRAGDGGTKIQIRIRRSLFGN